MRGRRRVLVMAAVVAATLTGAGCTNLGGGGSAATAPAATTASGAAVAPAGGVSAILVEPTHDAQVVRGSDGKDHVEYNLLVVNAFSDPVTLTGVTVYGPGGAGLMEVSGAALDAATQTLYTHIPSPVIAASAAVVVEIDLPLPGGKVPEYVSNRIAYRLPAVPGAVIVDRPVVDGPRVEIDRTKATVIAPPVAGAGWLATSACCSPNVHRDLRLAQDGLRLTTAETFAVDWAKVEGDRVYDGDGSSNAQFYGFGADVLAVAGGAVVSVTDGVAESTPFASSVPETKEGFGGNTVMLRIADEVYAFYGHLQPGSITVHVGQKVTSGQVLGTLGNTGPSQGPHLHFGLLDRPDPFTGTSLPFVLASFTLAGTVDFGASTGDTLAITRESRSLRLAYPLYGDLVDLP